MKKPSALGKWVSKRRIELGMNQKELADLANLTPALICMLENGTSQDVKTETLKRLARALNVTVEELLKESA